jgi:hypothetical protein
MHMDNDITVTEFGELTAKGIVNCFRYSMLDKDGEKTNITHPDNPEHNDEWRAECIAKLRKDCDG